jgi:hypothetical protein
MDDFTVHKSDAHLIHFAHSLHSFKDPMYSLPNIHSGQVPPSMGSGELRSDSLVLIESGVVDGVQYTDWIHLDCDFHIGALGDTAPSGPWVGGSAYMRFYHGHVYALKNLPPSPNRQTPLHHYGVVQVPGSHTADQFFHYLDHHPDYAMKAIRPALPLPLLLHQIPPLVLPRPIVNFDTFANQLAKCVNLSFESHYETRRKEGSKEESKEQMEESIKTLERDIFGENLSDSANDETDQLNAEEYYIPVTQEEAEKEEHQEEGEDTKHYPSEVSIYGSDSDTDSEDSLYY